MSRRVKHECDACGFVTTVKPYDREGIGHHGQTKQLCALCAGTMTGVAIDHPHMANDLCLLKTICYVGNAILSAVQDADA